MNEIYKLQQSANMKQHMHWHYSCTKEDIKQQNLASARSVLEKDGRFLQVRGKLEIIIRISEGRRWIVQWITLIRILSKKINRTKFKVPNMTVKSYRTELANLWQRFPWHSEFTAVPVFIYLFCPTSVPTLWSTCVYTHIWLRRDCIWITVATI